MLCAGVSTLSTTGLPPVQCGAMEDHVTLNYADTVQGTSELSFHVLLPDDSPLYADINTALLGSGTWLPLPLDDKPIRLVIRRSATSDLTQLRVATVSASVLHVQSAIIEMYDLQGQLADRRTVCTPNALLTDSLHMSTKLIIVHHQLRTLFTCCDISNVF